MRLTIYFLFFSSLCFSQNDSISPKWNNCHIDTLLTGSGNLSRIHFSQDVWSKSKKLVVTELWNREFYDNGKVKTEYKGTRYYKGDGYMQHDGTKKIFNEVGRRISTKHLHYKLLFFF